MCWLKIGLVVFTFYSFPFNEAAAGFQKEPGFCPLDIKTLKIMYRIYLHIVRTGV